MGIDYFAVSEDRKETLWLPRMMGMYIYHNCDFITDVHDGYPVRGAYLTPEDVAEGRRDYLEALGECPGLPLVPPKVWGNFVQWLEAEPGVALLYSDNWDFPRPWKSDPSWTFRDTDWLLKGPGGEES